jgi:hypothetical protein
MRDFLTNRDETGREIVTFPETGKQYFVEYIGKNHTNWGDLNPATGKIEGSYGGKTRGSIDAKDSMITEENGFEDIKEGKGSPYYTIQRMHEEYKRSIGLI